jgi:hypothetical protein
VSLVNDAYWLMLFDANRYNFLLRVTFLRDRNTWNTFPGSE